MPSGTELKNNNKLVYIGVLVHNKNIIHSSHQGYIRIEMLNQANNRANAVMFIFSLKDIDYIRNIISGLSYDSSKPGWVQAAFPFPDVLYIRDGMPDYREKDIHLFLDKLKKANSQIVNNVYAFNKWELYKELRQEKELVSCLPETKLYQSYDSDLMPMLNKYGKVYLKACRGRQGLQVMQIQKIQEGYFQYSFFDRQVRQGKVRSALRRLVENFFGQKEFIVQQPINLIQIGSSKADLRAEVQRNGSGEVEVVAVSVRIGLHNSPITTHAASFTFNDFFARYMEYDEEAIVSLKEEVDDFLLTIYQAIEKHFGSFGEMGIDVGLDKAGKLWFIETNSQPAKVSLMNAYSGSTVIKAFKNPLEYALFLAGS